MGWRHTGAHECRTIDVSRVHRSREGPQVLKQQSAGLIPLGGVLAKRVHHDPVELSGDGGGACQRLRIEKEDGADDVGGG